MCPLTPVNEESLNEEESLTALRRCALLDTPPEASFDRLTALAARLFGVALAFVTLMDRDRPCLKSCQGPGRSVLGLDEMSRGLSFCANTLLSTEALVVEDSCGDPRFTGHPALSGDFPLRFYAGMPLLDAEGHALGALCLLDFQPHVFSDQQRASLADLAACVVSEIELRRALSALADSERLGRQMFSDSPHPMWVFDIETLRFLAVNEVALAHYGYSRPEFLAMTLTDLRPPEELARLRAAKPGSGLQPGEKSLWQHWKKDGTRIWVEIAAHSVDYGGRAARMVIAGDVTERKQAEDALHRSLTMMQAQQEAALDGILVVDERRRIISYNQRLCEMWSVPDHIRCSSEDDPLLAHVLSQVKHPDEFLQRVQYLYEHPSERSREEIELADGRTFDRYSGPMSSEEGECYGRIWFFRDITDRRALEAEREELLFQTEALLADALESADHDLLTGLINHRVFHKRLEEETEAAQRSGRSLALVLMDINDFKFFNGAYGHLAGDDVLRQVAQALRSACRPGDTLARFGGDEFALLMPGATSAEAAHAGNILREAVAQVGCRPPGYDTAIPLSLSVGTACAPSDGAGRTALLEAADARLRVARSGGDEGQTMRLRRTMTRSVEGFSMLDALVTAVDNKDRYTRKHSEDVLTYSVRIARALGLDAATQRVVEVAALLHDVGKIGVPDAILRKPGRLTEEEFAAVKQHPLMGAIIVGAVPGFEEALEAVRHHHERWDGEGYPFGLSGAETPLLARLMAVADAYSAMTTDRPYRKGMEPCRARRLLEEGAGTQWDPACVAAFLRPDA